MGRRSNDMAGSLNVGSSAGEISTMCDGTGSPRRTNSCTAASPMAPPAESPYTLTFSAPC